MSLQLLERLTDFDKEVRAHQFKTTGIVQDANLPMDKDIYTNYITTQKQDVKSYSFSHLRDYIHFTYHDEITHHFGKLSNGINKRNRNY